jgi:hypothetical protein
MRAILRYIYNFFVIPEKKRSRLVYRRRRPFGPSCGLKNK